MMQKIEMSWAWIGGFFEGEGSIHWYPSKTKTKQGINGRIFIGQKIKDPLQQIYDFLKNEGFERAGLYLRKQAKKGANSLAEPCEIWVVAIQQRDEVVKFLEKVTPYLIQKREQALFVMGELKRLRSERDDILARALEMRNQGKTWAEVSKTLKIKPVSISNYARSKGIYVRQKEKGSEPFTQKKWRDQRVASGLCRNCGKPRDGKSSYKCTHCIEKYNEYKREWKKKRKPA